MDPIVDQPQEQPPHNAIKDLIAGAAGGIAQVLIGQPFDIVKVRLQTQAQGNAFTCAKSIFVNEGALAFYKGSMLPLMGIGACVSIQFGAFHEARRYIERYNLAQGHSQELSLTQFYFAGAAAGLANSVISGPIEHIRIRLQTQSHGKDRLYSGPFDCVKKIYRQDGIFRGLYRGQAVTLYREAHGYGIWFLAFEALVNADMKRNSCPREDISSLKIALYGGLAGETLWLLSHPLDVIKSKMQSDGFGEEKQFKTMRDCFSQTYRTQAVRGLFRGLGPALIRAMPVSAGTFATVEVVRRALN